MNITREDAEVILHMTDVCYGEGIDPDNSDLLKRIREAFPDLVDGAYEHLYR